MDKTLNQLGDAKAKAMKQAFILGCCEGMLEGVISKASGNEAMNSIESQAAVEKLMHLPLATIAERVYNERKVNPGMRKLNAILATHKTKVIV